MAEEDILDRADRVAVYLDRVIYVRGVTSAHRRNDRYIMLRSKLKNHSIAATQAVDRQTETAELVAFDGTDVTALYEHDIVFGAPLDLLPRERLADQPF